MWKWKLLRKISVPSFSAAYFVTVLLLQQYVISEREDFVCFNLRSLLHAKTTSPPTPFFHPSLSTSSPHFSNFHITEKMSTTCRPRPVVWRGRLKWAHKIMCVRAKFANPSVLEVGKSSSHVMSFLNYRSRLGGKIIRENSNFASSLRLFFHHTHFHIFFSIGVPTEFSSGCWQRPSRRTLNNSQALITGPAHHTIPSTLWEMKKKMKYKNFMLIYIRYQDLYFIAWHVILFYTRCCHFFSFYSSSCAICLLAFSSRATLEGSDASSPCRVVNFSSVFHFPATTSRHSKFIFYSKLTSRLLFFCFFFFWLCIWRMSELWTANILIFLWRIHFFFSPISFSPPPQQHTIERV